VGVTTPELGAAACAARSVALCTAAVARFAVCFTESGSGVFEMLSEM
jgi:hypothetical protein